MVATKLILVSLSVVAALVVIVPSIDANKGSQWPQGGYGGYPPSSPPPSSGNSSCDSCNSCDCSSSSSSCPCPCNSSCCINGTALQNLSDTTINFIYDIDNAVESFINERFTTLQNLTANVGYDLQGLTANVSELLKYGASDFNEQTFNLSVAVEQEVFCNCNSTCDAATAVENINQLFAAYITYINDNYDILFTQIINNITAVTVSRLLDVTFVTQDFNTTAGNLISTLNNDEYDLRESLFSFVYSLLSSGCSTC